jgi:hypothetical protein
MNWNIGWPTNPCRSTMNGLLAERGAGYGTTRAQPQHPQRLSQCWLLGVSSRRRSAEGPTSAPARWRQPTRCSTSTRQPSLWPWITCDPSADWHWADCKRNSTTHGPIPRNVCTPPLPWPTWRRCRKTSCATPLRRHPRVSAPTSWRHSHTTSKPPCRNWRGALGPPLKTPREHATRSLPYTLAIPRRPRMPLRRAATRTIARL